MTKSVRNSIFNPQWNDSVSARSIIKWSTTWLFNLNDVKYTWAKPMYQTMVGNFWLPEKVSGLKDDQRDFTSTLTPEEQRAYKWILSFLIFLDSIQTVNLPNINNYITSPEVNLLLSIQSYQEAIHSQSYATILESVVSAEERDEIYYFWRDNKILLERNKFIGQIYQDFIDNPSDENFFKTVVANFILESIYFYNGFAFFDTLVDWMKMPATWRMIAYIRRDELTHITLFANILREIKREFPEMWDEELIVDMMKAAVNQEVEWATFILGNKIIWMNWDTTKEYTEWLGNQRLWMLGIKPVFKSWIKNPYLHLDRIQNSNGDKGNFFETTVVNYTQSSNMSWTWDF